MFLTSRAEILHNGRAIMTTDRNAAETEGSRAYGKLWKGARNDERIEARDRPSM